MNLQLPDISSTRSLPEALFRTSNTHAAAPAQWHRHNGSYLPITYAQLADQIHRVASGLIKAGIEPGDRVAILMENRPEWAVIDYAVLAIGAVTVPLYCSYRPQDIAYVLNDAGVRTVFSSGDKMLKHLLEALNSVKSVRQLYCVDDDPTSHKLMHSFAALEGHEIDEAAIEKRLGQIDRDTLASLVYTSGTTANPKGVMLSHGNFLTNLESVPMIFPELRSDDRLLSFLPLAHALERTAGHFFPYAFGLSVAFAERPDTVAKNLGEAKPTMMISVPRLLEVIRSRILAQIGKESAFKQSLFHRYIALAGNRSRGLFGNMIYNLLDRLVGEKIRARFGGRLRALASGGAPLSVEVGQFFEALGLPVLEGYGLTESAPLISANPADDRRLGTVGRIAKGVEVKIAEDGEIVVRGGNVMAGYWKNKAATREALIDGWLHTGDIGTLEDGYLTITDRKKDLIVNSGGENIAPQRIEGLLIVDEEIDQVVLYGDQRPYLVALVIPNQEAGIKWAAGQGLPNSSWAQLCESPVYRKHLQTRISAILKPLNPFEQVRRIHLLHQPFTIESGLMTPTMKIKRRKVHEQYHDILESLYN